jgi:hypothetical protein
VWATALSRVTAIACAKSVSLLFQWPTCRWAATASASTAATAAAPIARRHPG